MNMIKKLLHSKYIANYGRLLIVVIIAITIAAVTAGRHYYALKYQSAKNTQTSLTVPSDNQSNVNDSNSSNSNSTTNTAAPASTSATAMPSPTPPTQPANSQSSAKESAYEQFFMGNYNSMRSVADSANSDSATVSSVLTAESTAHDASSSQIRYATQLPSNRYQSWGELGTASDELTLHYLPERLLELQIPGGCPAAQGSPYEQSCNSSSATVAETLNQFNQYMLKAMSLYQSGD